ncbi:hypothetical protein K469DRAFT_717093 [Zopfia rhizophila CBS 207.26]|uniref:Secreted protein n=1 Tax=Zopfia rhizophila CBS 207.26 TaxID=1314779 RepID=A0A6A6EPB8_9PEZI|nr:hypothetical protein K469DRAFT_717093 [Zopfia rhizophila CBS 207.26]
MAKSCRCPQLSALLITCAASPLCDLQACFSLCSHVTLPSMLISGTVNLQSARSRQNRSGCSRFPEFLCCHCLLLGRCPVPPLGLRGLGPWASKYHAAISVHKLISESGACPRKTKGDLSPLRPHPRLYRAPKVKGRSTHSRSSGIGQTKLQTTRSAKVKISYIDSQPTLRYSQVGKMIGVLESL